MQKDMLDKKTIDLSISTLQRSARKKMVALEMLPMIYVGVATLYHVNVDGYVQVDAGCNEYISAGLNIFVYALMAMVCAMPISGLIRKYLQINHFAINGLLAIRVNVIEGKISEDDITMFRKLTTVGGAKRLMANMANGNGL